MCNKRFQTCSMKGWTLEEVYDSLGDSKDIQSVLEPEYEEEEELLRSILEAEEDYAGYDGIQDLWSDYLVVKKKKICWQGLYDRDVASRVPIEDNGGRKEAQNPSLVQLLKELEDRLMERMREGFEKMNGAHLDLEKKVLRLKEKVKEIRSEVRGGFSWDGFERGDNYDNVGEPSGTTNAEKGTEKGTETANAGSDDLGIAQPSVTDDPGTANAEQVKEKGTEIANAVADAPVTEMDIEKGTKTAEEEEPGTIDALGTENKEQEEEPKGDEQKEAEEEEEKEEEQKGEEQKGAEEKEDEQEEEKGDEQGAGITCIPVITEIESEEEAVPHSAMIVFSGEVTYPPVITEIEAEAEESVEKQNVGKQNVEKQNVDKQKVTKERTPRPKRKTEPSRHKKPPYTEGKPNKKIKAEAEAEVEKKRGRKDNNEGRSTRQKTKK